jgi:hypothetical protein
MLSSDREAKPEELEPLLELLFPPPAVLDIRFLACVMSWTMKSKT